MHTHIQQADDFWTRGCIWMPVCSLILSLSLSLCLFLFRSFGFVFDFWKMAAVTRGIMSMRKKKTRRRRRRRNWSLEYHTASVSQLQHRLVTSACNENSARFNALFVSLFSPSTLLPPPPPLRPALSSHSSPPVSDSWIFFPNWPLVGRGVYKRNCLRGSWGWARPNRWTYH